VAIKQMVQDLNMGIEIVGMPTAREADGLAMSSRNVYLKEEERKSALSLSRSLKLAKDMYEIGERNAAVILHEVKKYIEGHAYTRVDYTKICDATTLENIDQIEGDAVLALAVRIGSTRLIDNYVFGDILPI
ncbi:MAG: pantoate--beta-alanine ligase, partial [Deltaproteobacteria bacterium]|nr:pantoate--beta-alanine ligase [Deltaproteobacteria bacterium]